MKIIKKIISIVFVLLSLPFLLVALFDYFIASKDSINIIIFGIFLIPFVPSVVYLIKDNRKNTKIQEELLDHHHEHPKTDLSFDNYKYNSERIDFSKKNSIKTTDYSFGTLSMGKLQRKYNIGFNRANQIMDVLYSKGFVGEQDGFNPRKLLCEEQKVFKYIENNKYNLNLYNEFCDYKYTPERIDPYVNNNYATFDVMDGHEFEHFCASILEKNGFESIDVTKGSGDQGIDIVAIKEDVKYGIQCKCHSSDIGNKAVQEAIAGKKFYDCHVGVVLTNQYFTKSAKELAKKTGILLWDRAYLEKLIKNSKE